MEFTGTETGCNCENILEFKNDLIGHFKAATNLDNVIVYGSNKEEVVLRIPYKNGYRFLGWYDETNMRVSRDQEFILTDIDLSIEHTYTARFEYSIEYYYDNVLDSNKTELLTGIKNGVINKIGLSLNITKFIHKETIKRTIFFSMFLNSFLIHNLLLDSNIILSNPSIYKIHFKRV